MKCMKQIYSIALLLLLLLSVSTGVSAQIKGVITDSLTHEPLMYITVQYEGKGVGGISNAEGEYQVETRKGWNELTFSAIGYITKKVKFAPGTKVLNVELAPADVMLSEVVVKPKKEKYSRKNNPAVEFMKKVIENKKALKLEENDYYQYQKYEKMKMSVNDVTPEKMEKGIYKKFSFFKDQVEVSPKTNKMILPISIKETSSKTIYRKNPKSEKTIIEGMNSSGIEEFFNTGDMLGTILTVFPETTFGSATFTIRRHNMTFILQMEKRPIIPVSTKIHMASSSSIASVGTSFRNVFLAAKVRRPSPALTRTAIDLYIIYKV